MQGFYSVLQFCPDRGRAESVNVGALLVCPSALYVGAKVVDSVERVLRVFPNSELSSVRLKAALRAFRLRAESSSLRGLDLAGFKKFVDTRANELLLTPPRQTLVDDPKADLETLFNALVMPSSQTARLGRPRKVKIPALEQLFSDLESSGLAKRDVDIDIPIAARSIRIPYVYKNSTDNLVLPVRLPSDERKRASRGLVIAAQGQLIHQCSKGIFDDYRSVKLVVVESPKEASTTNEASRFEALFEKFESTFVPASQLSRFIEQVKREAHD